MLDTNLLLDWLLQRNPSHSEIIDEFFDNAAELFVADVVIVELVYALEKFYELPRDLVAQNINIIITEPKISSSDAIFRKALSQYIEHPALSFVDCYLLFYAESKHVLPVWTFDKKLINQSNKLAKPIF